MNKRVLIIGGYGNFGRFIATMLAREDDIQVIIAGRNLDKANQLASQLNAINPVEVARIDINQGFANVLAAIAPDLVIHTSGPYQGQDYDVALVCIEQGCHYIDLADARSFVSQITSLDEAAKANNVLICSGASSVPGLTSAIIDKYIEEFDCLESIEYGIATAQRTNRGLATTSAILSYAGKPFKTLIDGELRNVYGWLDLKSRLFWGLNNRLLGNCDIPDLDLFPVRYPTLKTIRFQAGLELKLLHLILAALSNLVRIKLIPSLQPLAPLLLGISRIFDFFGKDDSGFYMEMTGRGKEADKQKVVFEIVAHDSDGLYIPSIPAILMAKKLARNEISKTGAYPCMGFIDLDDLERAFRLE